MELFFDTLSLECELRALCFHSTWATSPVHFALVILEVGGRGLINYLPRLALNLNPPNLSFPNSRDYRSEPLASDYIREFFKIIFISLYELYKKVSLWYFHRCIRCTCITFLSLFPYLLKNFLVNFVNEFHHDPFICTHNLFWFCSLHRVPLLCSYSFFRPRFCI
jgi:hypothetical protein